MNYNSEVYRPPTGSAGAEKDNSKLGQTFRVFTWIVLGSLMVVWGVIGFIFWLPQMVREMFGFSIALVHASLTKGSIEPAGDKMREAINFYRRGFEMAHDAIMTPKTPSEAVAARAVVSTERLFKEALWATLVWWILLSVLGMTDATPLALVQWLISGAWLETLDGLLVRFWMWLDGLMPSSATPSAPAVSAPVSPTPVSPPPPG